MKTEALRKALDALSAREGILGCALVELETGMVWHASGSLDSIEDMASCASDYWRLHRRTQHIFAPLGDLRVAMLMHGKGQITVRECGAGVLLVTLTTRLAAVDWKRWKDDHPVLADLVNSF